MRKAVIIVVVLAVVAAAGWLIYQQINKAQTAASPAWDVVEVVRGDIAVTVSATGEVLPEREASLAFKSAGAVAEVGVEAGATVAAGTLLARLDTGDLELAVRQAEVALRQAEAQLRQVQEGAQSSELAAAQAALNSARQAYQEVLKGSDADELAAASAQVEQARASLQQAQAAYDRVKDRPDIGMLPQSLQLQQATIALEAAEAQYRLASRGATQAQASQAQAQVAQAQANLDRLRQGASTAQLDVAQAAVDQAQLSLEQAQRRLDDAALVAPWDGVVTAISLVEGALVQPGVAVVQLADTSRFHLDVQVDEVDVAALAPGQAVTIEVDALPDLGLTGAVLRIAPAGGASSTGGVTYPVRVDIDETDAPLRAGMSATATIVASKLEDVLLLPSRAAQLERETGRTFVERLVGGEPERVEVRLGLRDDRNVEVREGLEAGDRIAVRSVSGLQRLQQTFTGGF